MAISDNSKKHKEDSYLIVSDQGKAGKVKASKIKTKTAFKSNDLKAVLVLGVPARARTVDPLIKSQMLYQLSYGDKILFSSLIG